MSYWFVVTVMVSVLTVMVSMHWLICLNVIQMTQCFVLTVVV